jgi:steroid delta-isomerase-like uncharacterized protein
MATPAELARAIFDAIQKGDIETAMTHGADDAVDDFVAIGEFRGKRAIREFFEELLAAFPDFDMTVERIVGNDESAVVQWHARGTFSGGPFQGIEPTESRVDIRGVDVMEFADGLLQHNTIYYDGASFARQIGMLPRSHSATDKAMLATFNAKTRIRHRARDRRDRRDGRRSSSVD